MKLYKQQNGISPIIIVLLILLLAILGFAGWTVYNANNQSKPPAANTGNTGSTDNQKRVRIVATVLKPISEAYSVEQPSTWAHGTCPDNPDILFLAPTSATLGKCQTEYFGTVAITKNTGDIGHNEEYYTADEYYSEVTYSSVTIDGITGYKVGYTVADVGELGVGPAAGTKIIQYVLFDGTDTYSISYSRTDGEEDLSSTVQTLAESFNKL